MLLAASCILEQIVLIWLQLSLIANNDSVAVICIQYTINVSYLLHLAPFMSVTAITNMLVNESNEQDVLDYCMIFDDNNVIFDDHNEQDVLNYDI